MSSTLGPAKFFKKTKKNSIYSLYSKLLILIGNYLKIDIHMR